MKSANGTKMLVRRRKGRMVAGICAGVAGFFGWDVTVVRVVVAVVSVMTGGTGVLAYLVAWALIPVEGEKTSIAEDLIGVTTGETYASLARELVSSLVRSPDYSARDIIRTVPGITATQAALLPDLASMDLTRSLPRIDVPVVMVQGRHDQVAPGESARQYASSLQAPSKQLIWFETSAHTPHLEEPAKFRDVLLGIRDSQHART